MKKFITLLLSIILGFGLVYLLGWLFSNQMNPLHWDDGGKFIYVIISLYATNIISNKLE